MKCPRCHDVELVEGGPLSSTTCPRCGGGLLPEVGLATLLDELKHTREELRELASLYAGARLPCPSCRSKMSPLVLRGEHVDVCFGCGALWLDRGELSSITLGRHALPAPREPVDEQALARKRALAAPAQALVRIDERTFGRHLARAALAGAGAVGVIWSVVGIAPGTSMLMGVVALGVAAGLSRRNTFEVHPRAGNMVRWRGYFAPTPGAVAESPFSPDSCVVVRPARALGRVWPGVMLDLVDAEGRFLARLRGPIPAMRAWTEAPRYARALGVSVRFDLDPAADDVLDAEQQMRPDLPQLALHDQLRLEPDAAGRVFAVRTPEGAAVGTVSAEIAMRGAQKGLDDVLAQHFVLSADGGPSVRLFSTVQLGRRATVLVLDGGHVLGHVAARRGALFDTYAFAGPQGRRSATARLRHGSSAALLVDGYGRRAGTLAVGDAAPSEPRTTTLRLAPGRLTGDARVGLVALAFHVALASVVTDLD